MKIFKSRKNLQISGQLVQVQYAYSELEKDRVRVFLGAERAGGATGAPHDRGREGEMGGRGPVSWDVGG